MNEVLIYFLGMLVGFVVTAVIALRVHKNYVNELGDEFASLRETIRRQAYARGYEAAKVGEVKRS